MVTANRAEGLAAGSEQGVHAGTLGTGDDVGQLVHLTQGALVGVLQQAVEHEPADHDVQTASGVVRIMPMDAAAVTA